MIPINEALEQYIQSLIDERSGVSQHIERLKDYEETLINDTRHFKRLLKRRTHNLNAEICNSVVADLTVMLIMSTRNQKRRELWDKI